MRQERLEYAACRIGMRRDSRRDGRPGCRGTCASCRCWGLLGRALRVRVGEDRPAVEAYIDRFLAARRMPAARRRDVRTGVLRSLAARGLWAKDGRLLFDAGTGRLCFARPKAGP